MEDERTKKYLNAKMEVKAAMEWNNLPFGPRYYDDTFEISVAHCTLPVMVRYGQQHEGDKLLWGTCNGFNVAIMEYLVETWDEHFPRILARLKEKESAALKQCQSYIDEMQRAIDDA